MKIKIYLFCFLTDIMRANMNGVPIVKISMLSVTMILSVFPLVATIKNVCVNRIYSKNTFIKSQNLMLISY